MKGTHTSGSVGLDNGGQLQVQSSASLKKDISLLVNTQNNNCCLSVDRVMVLKSDFNRKL